MNHHQIAEIAGDIHREIWRGRVALGIDAWSPLRMLEPAIAAAVLGVHFEEVDGLGQMGPPGPLTEVAGRIDRSRKLIQVSLRFPVVVRRFTGAHEVGHWLIHPQAVMHRDRPAEGGRGITPRSREEREADYFAACFLIPERRVLAAYRRRFGTPPLRVNEEVAFALSPDDPDAVYAASPEQLAGMLAAFKHHRLFPLSLAEEFRVSVSAMAYRLLELGAVTQ